MMRCKVASVVVFTRARGRRRNEPSPGRSGALRDLVMSKRRATPASPAPGSEPASVNDVQSEPETGSEASDEALARLALREVAGSPRAPASARAAAARTLLEAGGLIGRLQEKPRNSKGLNEMTREELESEIARLRAPGSEPTGEEDDPFALSH